MKTSLSYRKFGGKEYAHENSFLTKRDAEKEARRLRGKGNSVRIVKVSSKRNKFPYDIYIREK